jgi:hypothetical protein
MTFRIARIVASTIFPACKFTRTFSPTRNSRSGFLDGMGGDILTSCRRKSRVLHLYIYTKITIFSHSKVRGSRPSQASAFMPQNEGWLLPFERSHLFATSTATIYPARANCAAAAANSLCNFFLRAAVLVPRPPCAHCALLHLVRGRGSGRLSERIKLWEAIPPEWYWLGPDPPVG